MFAILQLLGNLCHDFTWNSRFLISNSQIDFFLFKPDLPTDSHGTAPIFEIRVLDWFHKKAISELIFLHLLVSMSASASDNRLWTAHSCRTAKSAFLFEVDMQIFFQTNFELIQELDLFSSWIRFFNMSDVLTHHCATVSCCELTTVRREAKHSPHWLGQIVSYRCLCRMLLKTVGGFARCDCGSDTFSGRLDSTHWHRNTGCPLTQKFSTISAVTFRSPSSVRTIPFVLFSWAEEWPMFAGNLFS